MADYLDTLHDGLVAASRRLCAQRRRRWRRRGGAATALVVLIGAPALAATGVWRPTIGDGHTPATKITASLPPADQLALLAVLRRPQTAADRGAVTLDALKVFGGSSLHGIRTNSIRLLAHGAQDRGLVLVPVARYARELPPIAGKSISLPAITNALCLIQLEQNAAQGAGVACWSSADVRDGRAWMGLGQRVAQLVPDGVATVRTTYPGAPPVEAAVHDNLARFSTPRGRTGSGTTTFLDAQGATVHTAAPPKPPETTGFPTDSEPVPDGATHTGGVERIVIRGDGVDAHYAVSVAPPKRGPVPLMIAFSLDRPACAGQRHISVLLGGVSSGARLGGEITPATAKLTRWCPGTYRGSYRYRGERKPFGTFSFRVAG